VVDVEQREELAELTGEVLRAEAGRRPAQRRRRHLVGPGRPADAEVDPARVERLEERELLGDDERRVVRQHDAAGADADPRGPRRDVGDEHRRARARDRGHPVVLGEPEARHAEALGGDGEIACGAEGVAARLALADEGEVEHGQGHGSGGSQHPTGQRGGGGRHSPGGRRQRPGGNLRSRRFYRSGGER
jgi:hypothetical protein